MFIFRKIWRALFSWNTGFKIRPIALLPTVCTNFSSFIPEIYKTGLTKLLPFRFLSLCLDFVKFYCEINTLKSILYKNINPRDFVDKYTKEFLDRILNAQNCSKFNAQNWIDYMPYFGKMSFQIRIKINRVMENKLPNCNLRIAFRIKCKLINFFTFKDKIPVSFSLDIVYKRRCGGWNTTYYGKTSVILELECVNTFGVPAFTGKTVKMDNNLTIKEHHLFRLMIFPYYPATTMTLKLL